MSATLLIVDFTESRPAYQQVAEHLATEIARGRWAIGEKLPSRVELVETYGVANMTMNRVIDVLRRQGLVASQQGRGVFVIATQPKADEDRIAALEDRVAELERTLDDLTRRGP